jgi:hypothetical protein
LCLFKRMCDKKVSHDKKVTKKFPNRDRCRGLDSLLETFLMMCRSTSALSLIRHKKRKEMVWRQVWREADVRCQSHPTWRTDVSLDN